MSKKEAATLFLKVFNTSINMERELGYYWCKAYGSNHWYVSEWMGGHWLIIGQGGKYSEDTWEKINETRIEPPQN